MAGAAHERQSLLLAASTAENDSLRAEIQHMVNERSAADLVLQELLTAAETGRANLNRFSSILF